MKRLRGTPNRWVTVGRRRRKPLENLSARVYGGGMWWRWLLFIAFLVGVRTADAHPGGLNSSGCHNNRKTGDYHCHRAAAPAPAMNRAPAPVARKPAGPIVRDFASAKPARSAAAKAAFRRENPCPATGRTTGSCDGWEVDHILPLACNGPDTPENMQWLTREQNRRKGSMGCRRR